MSLSPPPIRQSKRHQYHATPQYSGNRFCIADGTSAGRADSVGESGYPLSFPILSGSVPTDQPETRGCLFVLIISFMDSILNCYCIYGERGICTNRFFGTRCNAPLRNRSDGLRYQLCFFFRTTAAAAAVMQTITAGRRTSDVGGVGLFSS